MTGKMPIIGIVIFLLEIPVIFLVLYIVRRTNQRKTELFNQVAASFNGRVTANTFIKYPRLFVAAGSTEAEISTFTGGKKSPPSTSFCAKIQNLRGVQMFIYRQYSIHQGLKFFGLKDALTGDQDFDASFVIQTADETAVLGFFNEEVKAILREWKEAHPSLKIRKDDFVFEVSRCLKDAASLTRFIECGRSLLEKARAIS